MSTQKAWRVTYVRAYDVDVFADTEEAALYEALTLLINGGSVNVSGLEHVATSPLKLDEDGNVIDE